MGSSGMGPPCPASRQHWEVSLHMEPVAWAVLGRSLLGPSSPGHEAVLGRADADAAVCGQEESHGLWYQPREARFCCIVT